MGDEGRGAVGGGGEVEGREVRWRGGEEGCCGRCMVTSQFVLQIPHVYIIIVRVLSDPCGQQCLLQEYLQRT